MKEFTQKEWEEVLERIGQITSLQESNAYVNELKKTYNLYPLNEMAKNRRDYMCLCISQSTNIHYTVANLICLADTICQDARLHWRRELLTFSKDIISIRVEKSVKRTATVIDKIIESYMDPYNITHYTYNDSYIYEKAMQCEIKKSKLSTATKVQQIEGNQIEKMILPNIEKFVEPNKERVSVLFDNFILACKKEDLDIFEKAVDEFILNAPNIIL